MQCGCCFLLVIGKKILLLISAIANEMLCKKKNKNLSKYQVKCCLTNSLVTAQSGTDALKADVFVCVASKTSDGDGVLVRLV